MSTELERRRAQLVKTRQRLERARTEAEIARSKSQAATPGGLTGYDPAVLSGIRRKSNRKADERRWNAYDKEASAALAVDGLEREVSRLERIVAELEAPRPSLTEIRSARAIRTKYGWHRVVRVNAKSVTVETPYSWTDLIPLKDVLEARA